MPTNTQRCGRPTVFSGDTNLRVSEFEEVARGNIDYKRPGPRARDVKV